MGGELKEYIRFETRLATVDIMTLLNIVITQVVMLHSFTYISKASEKILYNQKIIN